MRSKEKIRLFPVLESGLKTTHGQYFLMIWVAQWTVSSAVGKWVATVSRGWG